LVVHSSGLDEISTAGETRLIELKEGRVTTRQLNPKGLGMRKARLEDLRVDTPHESAQTLRGILEGGHQGPKRDIIILNAAAGIMVGGKAGSIEEGMVAADESIRSGSALACLAKLVELSNG
jgi:anthranilate phosphoribosyltransferase